MKSRLFWSILRGLGLALGLGLCLFLERFSHSAPGLLGSSSREVMAVFRDPGTQWMVFLCAAIYFLTFTALGKPGQPPAQRGARAYQLSTLNYQLLHSPDFWLCALLLIAALAYALDYERASTSTQALVLLAGAAIGKGARLWANWGSAQNGKADSPTTEHAKVDTDKPEFQHVSVSGFQHLPQALHSSAPHSPADVPNFQPSTLNLQLLLFVLLLLLSVASLWHPDGALQFQYRGKVRWSGPWDNPNIFGLLMGVGVVIGAGLLFSGCRFQVHALGGASVPASLVKHLPPSPAREDARPTGFQLFCISAFPRSLCFAALVLCSVGLLKSYSRGAWLGTALGLALLAYQVLRGWVLPVGQAFQPAGSPDFPVRCSQSATENVAAPLAMPASADRNVRPTTPDAPIHSFNSSTLHSINLLRRRWRPWSVVLLSVLVLAFWQFRFTDFHPVRRVFSVGNLNDFSWRNRVVAWEGALAMMADRPFTGFGWNQPERIYDQFYRPARVPEGMAIQLNHFFTLGMSLGLPALLCFGAYIGLSLTRNSEPRTRNPERANLQPSTFNLQLCNVCHFAAVVLLIGLWFDGGLFNLATAAPFWVLLELGRGTALPACRGMAQRAAAVELTAATHAQEAHVTTTPIAPKCSRLPDPVGISCGSCVSWFKPSLVVVFALLLTALFWAKARDPFHRDWFSVKTPLGGCLSAVVVTPDRGGPFPVVVFAHGSGGSAQSSGETLRLLAAQGFAAVGFDYNQTNTARFDVQFAALLDEVAKKEWAAPADAKLQPATFNQQPEAAANRKSEIVNHKSVAWVGHSLGAQRQLSFLARHPARQPNALVRLNGGWVEELDAPVFQAPSSILAGLPAWLAHGENDEVFPAGDARKVAQTLRVAGAVVRLDVYPGRGHRFGDDQPLLIKAAAEFCARELAGTISVPVNARPGLYYFWLPVGLFGLALLGRRGRRRNPEPAAASPARWVRVAAALALLGAGLVSAAHLALPLLRATPATLNFARSWSVRPELRADFDWLVQQPAARDCRIRVLLEHLDLATLQRPQFAASLSDNDWREFVLSPWVTEPQEDIVSRRVLWESLAPRVRRETDAEQAALQVVRQLRLGLQVGPEQGRGPTQPAGAAWNSRGALAVAALRAVGIPARLDPQGEPLMRVREKWIPLPKTVLGD